MNINEFFNNMKRCVICILPETFPGIEFDEIGICNYCRDYEKIDVMGEEALEKTLSQYRNKGNKYDCIVPISGGRDSSFVLHQIVKKYEMNPLALTVDSGAITLEGYQNIDRIIKRLNVDHVWIKDENQIKTAKLNTKIKFHAWLKKPSIHTIVPVLNAGDKTMNLRIYNYADKKNIHLIIGGNVVGNSSIEQEHFKTGFLGIFPNDRGIYSSYDKIKLLFLYGWEFVKNYHNFHWSVFKEYFEGAFMYFFESAFKPQAIVPLGFYDYIYWNEKEILHTIRNELDWEGALDTTATWRVDDAAYTLIDYLYYTLVGFTEFDELYSKMIRERQISRNEALKRCINDNSPRIERLENNLEDLDVTKEQIDEVINEYRINLFKHFIFKK